MDWRDWEERIEERARIAAMRQRDIDAFACGWRPVELPQRRVAAGPPAAGARAADTTRHDGRRGGGAVFCSGFWDRAFVGSLSRLNSWRPYAHCQAGALREVSWR
jgi:hypothetical protein